MTTYLKAAREIDNGCVKIIIEREGQDIELRSNEWMNRRNNRSISISISMMWRLETVLFRRIGGLGSWHLKQLHSCLSKVLSVEIIPSQVKSNYTEFLFEQKIPLAYCAIDLLLYWLRTRKTLAKNEENPVEGRGNRKGKATRKHSNRLEFAWSIGQMTVDWQKSTNNQVEVIESRWAW